MSLENAFRGQRGRRARWGRGVCRAGSAEGARAAGRAGCRRDGAPGTVPVVPAVLPGGQVAGGAGAGGWSTRFSSPAPDPCSRGPCNEALVCASPWGLTGLCPLAGVAPPGTGGRRGLTCPPAGVGGRECPVRRAHRVLYGRAVLQDSLRVPAGTVPAATGVPGHVLVGTVPTTVARTARKCHGEVGMAGREPRGHPSPSADRVCREPCGSGHATASCQSVYVCLGRELPEAAAHPRAWPPSKARTPCVAGKGRSGCPGAAGGGSSGPGQRQAASSPLPGGTRPGCAPCSPRAREMLGVGPHATCHPVHTRDICAHHTYDTQTPHTPYTQHTLYIALCTHCLHARDIYTHPTHYMCTLYTPRIHHAVHPTPHTQHTHPVMSLVPFPADPRLTPLRSLGGRGTPEQVLVPGPCQVAT